MHSSGTPSVARRAEVLDVAAVQRIERAVHHRHLAAVVLQLLEVSTDHDLTSSPFCLQLVERLVEEVGGDIRRRLRPLDQLGEAVLERHLRREAERRLRARDVGRVVADVELAARLRDLRLDRRAEDAVRACVAISRMVTVSPEPTLTGR